MATYNMPWSIGETKWDLLDSYHSTQYDEQSGYALA
jgi:hypothetical protein